MQNWCAISDVVAEVRDYRMRDDGTPEYVMVNKMGPLRASHRSDYVVYEPPHRAEDDTLETSVGGRWVTVHEPVEGGTRVTHRLDVEPHGLMKLLFPLIRPPFAWTFSVISTRWSNESGPRAALSRSHGAVETSRDARAKRWRFPIRDAVRRGISPNLVWSKASRLRD